MDLNRARLRRILRETSFELANPNAEPDPNIAMVDCSLRHLGVYKDRAQEHRDEFIALLLKLRLPSLEEQCSYIPIASEIGGPDNLGLQFFALGHALGLWIVQTPEDYGIPPASSRSFAQQGGVIITDLRIPGLASSGPDNAA